MTAAPILAEFESGGARVRLHTDGTKVRTVFDPAIPPARPETLDLKVTGYCDAGCAWCHEGSTRRGQHGDVGAMLALLSELQPGAEIAIGGGDPLSHPEFERLVRGLRQHGLVPSVTVNGRHVVRHRATLERLARDGVLFGIGVSFFERFPEIDHPHVVDHMIAGVDDPEMLLADGLERRKILVLGYKTWGRGAGFRAKRNAEITARLSQWYRLLPLIALRHHLSFDTLAIEQMKPERLFRRREDFEMRFMGQEGAYSMYIDGVERTFAVSSYAPERMPWAKIEDMFSAVRKAVA